MSTLAITAAHFAGLPVRYAVGRWYNIPTNTLLAFNATELGLHILVRSVIEYAVQKHYWKIPEHLEVPIVLAYRVMYCLAGVYAASILAEPMPLKAAALTDLAALIAVWAASYIAMRSQGKK